MNNTQRECLSAKITNTAHALASSSVSLDDHLTLKTRVLVHVMYYHGDDLEDVIRYLSKLRDRKEAIINLGLNDMDPDDACVVVASHVIVLDLISAVEEVRSRRMVGKWELIGSQSTH